MSIARPRPRRLALAAAVPLALVAGCASADVDPAEPEAPPRDVTASPRSDVVEASTVSPRLVITHDDGVLVVDAMTLDAIDDIEIPGSVRATAAGDGRHVLLSTSNGFQVLDAGTWEVPHGDHSHYYTAPPALTDVVWEARTPGHVVSHDGRTALFDDGTGRVVVVSSTEIASGPDLAHEVREVTTPSAHHGAAVALNDVVVVTEGTQDARTGIRVLDFTGAVLGASDDCPGVHGIAVAGGGSVVLGCADGALVHGADGITKVGAPDPTGRIGTLAGTGLSPVVLGDYSETDADDGAPARVSLIDTRDGTVRLVDLPADYSSRSLARGAEGEALVLGTDGAVHVIDPASGALVRSIAVIDAWEVPSEWQEPRPTVVFLDGSAYVTDPATRSVHAVDVETGTVWRSGRFDVVPNEVVGVTGGVPQQDDHDHNQHDH